MNALATTKGFVGLLLANLILLGLGIRHIDGINTEAATLGKSNRDAEKYIQGQALDARSVRSRKQIARRLERRLESLQQLFAYHLDEESESDPAKIVGDAPNRFKDAVREVRDELSQTRLQFPADLGFESKSPGDAELRARVWQLDMVRHVLRAAQKAGFTEVPKDGIKPSTKHNLIDGENFLEYVKVDFKLHGPAEAMGRLLYEMLRPGKYYVLENVELSNGMQVMTGGRRKRKEKAAGRPTLKLTVATQALNLDAPGMKTDPIDDAKTKKSGTGRSPFYRFKR